jgi:hypothetical protein
MGNAKANCLVCGAPLVYHAQAQPETCVYCGTTELAHAVCTEGHYVCDACHRKRGVARVRELCRTAEERDPIALMMRLMRESEIYPNGPEHHTLVGAALLAAYANAGGAFARGMTLDQALDELEQRSMQVPGGSCGFWGCCGAAVSAGQALSIITGSTPYASDEWAQCQRLTSLILGRLADLGGPRCCKRSSFSAGFVAVDYIAETCGVRMDKPERVTCPFFPRNAQCLHEHCPYYPQRKRDGADETNDYGMRETSHA